MEIVFFTDWRFRAMVNGEARAFSVLWADDGKHSGCVLYVDEEKALAGDYDVRIGEIAEEGGHWLLRPWSGDNPMLKDMRDMLLTALREGSMLPVTEASAEEDERACGDEDDDLYDDGDEPAGGGTLRYDPTQDVAPEAGSPCPDLTPEERLLRAIFDEPVPEGMSELPREVRLGMKIFAAIDGDAAPDEDDTGDDGFPAI